MRCRQKSLYAHGEITGLVQRCIPIGAGRGLKPRFRTLPSPKSARCQEVPKRCQRRIVVYASGLLPPIGANRCPANRCHARPKAYASGRAALSRLRSPLLTVRQRLTPPIRPPVLHPVLEVLLEALRCQAWACLEANASGHAFPRPARRR